MSAKKPLFVFFGTPRFGVCVLDALESRGLLPALVVTAPDRPRGRGLTLTPTPVKTWAMERGIDVLTPERLGDAELAEALQNTDWDIFVVAAYTLLITPSILSMPRRGCLNVHPSLLPKFRGPSPVLSAILANERTTGVSIMFMDEELDHGPVVAQGRVEIDAADWPQRGSVLEDLLATEGGNLLAEVLPEWLSGSIVPVVQDETQATFTRKFVDEDALVDMKGLPETQLLKIRAFDKNPRAYALTPEGKRVIITDAEVVDGKLVILSVIPEGKREMSFEEFLRSGGTLL